MPRERIIVDRNLNTRSYRELNSDRVVFPLAAQRSSNRKSHQRRNNGDRAADAGAGELELEAQQPSHHAAHLPLLSHMYVSSDQIPSTNPPQKGLREYPLPSFTARSSIAQKDPQQRKPTADIPLTIPHSIPPHLPLRSTSPHLQLRPHLHHHDPPASHRLLLPQEHRRAAPRGAAMVERSRRVDGRQPVGV